MTHGFQNSLTHTFGVQSHYPAKLRDADIGGYFVLVRSLLQTNSEFSFTFAPRRTIELSLLTSQYKTTLFPGRLLAQGSPGNTLDPTEPFSDSTRR